MSTKIIHVDYQIFRLYKNKIAPPRTSLMRLGTCGPLTRNRRTGSVCSGRDDIPTIRIEPLSGPSCMHRLKAWKTNTFDGDNGDVKRFLAQPCIYMDLHPKRGMSRREGQGPPYNSGGMHAGGLAHVHGPPRARNELLYTLG
jgi:hypothetical protein